MLLIGPRTVIGPLRRTAMSKEQKSNKMDKKKPAKTAKEKKAAKRSKDDPKPFVPSSGGKS